MTLLNFDCGNQEALIGFLYEECDAIERAAISAHLMICSRCAAEVAGMRATRTSLAAWAPPDAQLGFRLVSDRELPPEVRPAAATVLRPSRWWRQPMPAWAQAAAAVLIFTVGTGLGALRGTAEKTPAPIASAPVQTAAAGVSQDELAALEQRLRSEINTQINQHLATTVSMASVPAQTGAAGQSNAAILNQVRLMIQDSEKRQQRDLALRTAEVVRDFDTQRRGDLTRIEQTFGQMEGTTGAQVEQQRQMLNYLMKVSSQTQGR
jgi:anti-sigma factor RsiW